MDHDPTELETFITRTNRLFRATMHPAAAQLPIEGRLPSLDGATGWLHSPPLTAAGLRGKVVLVDLWTYTCINWLRTLPYLRAWAERYQDHGLVVIGVHAPEFDFEHDLDNVRREAKRLRVAYPIAVDSDYASEPPGAAHGADVDDQGDGTLTDPRLYQLIRQPGPVTERTFEITFLDPGVQAYAFTFG
jgi:thiol-disulfide isomerase/thioredoxin